MIGIKLFTICMCLSCFHVAQLGNGLQVDNGNRESRAQNYKTQFKLFDFNYVNNFLEVNWGGSAPYTGAGSLLDHGTKAEIGIQSLPQSTIVHDPIITYKLGFQNSTLPIKMILTRSLILITALAVLFRLHQCFLVLAQKQTTSSRRLASEEECLIKNEEPEPEPKSEPELMAQEPKSKSMAQEPELEPKSMAQEPKSELEPEPKSQSMIRLNLRDPYIATLIIYMTCNSALAAAAAAFDPKHLIMSVVIAANLVAVGVIGLRSLWLKKNPAASEVDIESGSGSKSGPEPEDKVALLSE